jgi:hypothetical protein
MKNDNREKETTMVKTYEYVPESKVREAWRRYNTHNDLESNLEVERDIDAFMSRTGERDRTKHSQARHHLSVFRLAERGQKLRHRRPSAGPCSSENGR